jgi:hypothetical protein
MGIGKQPTSSAVRVLLIALAAEQELAIDPVVGRELAIDLAVVEPEPAPVEAELEHDLAEAELEHAQVVAELVLAQVVAELEHAQVAAEQVLAQVVAERELAQVEVVPEPGLLRAQPAVALRTKSVIGAHRRDLVPIAAVALAAAAETTRVPAATEAVVAWEVAVTAVAAAGIAVAAVGE